MTDAPAVRFVVVVGHGWAAVEIPEACPVAERWTRYLEPALLAAAQADRASRQQAWDGADAPDEEA